MKRWSGPLVLLGLLVPLSARGDDPSAPAARATDPAAVMDAALARLEASEKNLDRTLSDAARDEAATRKRLIALGRAYSRLMRVGVLPLSEGFSGLVRHAAAVERLRRVIATDSARLRALVLERTRAASERQALAGRRTQAEQEREAIAQARSALLSARERELAFSRAFESSDGADHTAVYGAWGPADPASASPGFARMKGRLPFPVPGRTEIFPARRRAADGPGLEMRVPSGSIVRAIYSGRVAFADEYADYGKTVILDHGDGYYTVSGDLQDIDVRVGDDIGGGARIGRTGRSLYFEIRRGTDTQEPGPWFGI
jgi:murein hydrolase activator